MRTFSGTVHVDSPWDDSPCEDLVEIASKFVEADGASERPDAIQYLSVHCDISLLILSSPSEAQKVPVHSASDGYRLELMLPKRRVPAAASPDSATEASPGRAVVTSPSVVSESCGGVRSDGRGWID